MTTLKESSLPPAIMEQVVVSKGVSPSSSTISDHENKKRSVCWWTAVAASILAIVGLVLGLTLGLLLPSDNDEKADIPESPEGVPTFSVDIETASNAWGTYESCNELQQDLEEAAKYFANSYIDTEARAYYHHEYRPSHPCPGCESPFLDTIAQQEGEAPAPGAPAPGSPPVQEAPAPSEPVTGDTLDTLDGDGPDSFGTNNQVQGVDEADFVKSDGTFVFAAYGDELVVLHADEVTVLTRITIPPMETPNENDRHLSIPPPPPDRDGTWSCNANIGGLLLHENILVVISSGSCWYNGYDAQDESVYPILTNPQGTRIFMYDVSLLPDELPLIGTKHVLGNYVSARQVDGNVHVVTNSEVQKYWHFSRYLDRWNDEIYANHLQENEYRRQAFEQAEERIEEFARLFVQEYQEATDTTTCDNFSKISLLQSSDNGENDTAQLEFSNGALDRLSLVTSLPIETSVGDDFSIHSSAMLVPTSYTIVYSSMQYLVRAAQGWNNGMDGNWHEETWFFVNALEGPSSRLVAKGRAPGSLLNQFAIDHAVQNDKDYLRVATTSSAQWGIVQEAPRIWDWVEESTSQVVVLEIVESEVDPMPVVGQASDIGRDERIFAVRFLGDRGFVVTFRQTDPFFTLDLAEPSDPHVVGELKIPGFSNYIHPIGNDLLLTVGQNATEEGRQTGLQIALFDVSDFANPQQIQVYSVENDDESHSSSDAQYDHRAFRYFDKTLIIPVEVYRWNGSRDNMDGFVVYDVDETTGIAPRFTIQHANSDDINHGCWSGNKYLYPRSLVFGGEAMTFKTHTVLNHDLDTKQQTAPLINLDSELSEEDCYYTYFEG